MISTKMILPFVVIVMFYSCSTSKKNVRSSSPELANAVKKDTTKKSIQPYNTIITDKAITRKGLITVHKVDDRYYFEIADSILKKDILIVNRISKAAAAVAPDARRMGYGGDQIGENVIQFVKGPNRNLFIERISTLDISRDSSENGMYRSVYNSSLLPIVAAFDIKAISPDSTASVIDMTDYIKGDNDLLFFDPQSRKALGLGGLLADKSYTQSITTFPLNTEIRTVKTYGFGDRVLTYELNSSLVLLPDEPMKPRYFDERVGYFARGYRDFDYPQAAKAAFMITRWRIEPKETDREKYKRGELVEPQKPIVFYIDPATPKKWVPYLIQGVNAWQTAFEKAGFKNAIYALEAPVNDTTWGLDDARHNVLIYKASFVQNASGPQVSDPRSGEILESHINWYHNVQQILRDWYFIQAAPNDPKARTMNFDDSLMGKLIRYVCTHEVGHTLGLQHNFIASASIPVDSLRSKSYVSKNGHTPSIMDYARFNYVAQPEDDIAENDLIPRIGVYDEWAIEWGYRWMPQIKTKEEEKKEMNEWIVQRLAGDKRLTFALERQEDFRNQAEDLGDNAMKAGFWGINNLKRVMSHLKDWTQTSTNNYSDLKRMHTELMNQFNRYMELASATIGYTSITPKTVEQSGPHIFFAEKEKQKAAVQFLQEQLFDNTQWLESKELFPLIGGGNIILLYKIQESIIHRVVSPTIYNLLLLNETNQSKETAYSFDELLTDLENGIWKELKNHQSIEIYRRAVQKIYITKLITFVQQSIPGDLGMLDGCTIVSDHIDKLYKKIDAILPHYTDHLSKIHLVDLRSRLKAAIDERKKYVGFPPQIFQGNRNSFDTEKARILLIDASPFPNEKNTKGCWANTYDLE
jgi:hypothetical protein